MTISFPRNWLSTSSRPTLARAALSSGSAGPVSSPQTTQPLPWASPAAPWTRSHRKPVSYRRGYLTSTIAQRGALHHDLGKCDQRLRAARALCREALDDAWEFCLRGERPDLEHQLRLRGACAYATDVACEIATTAFRYGGGSAIYNDRVLQRCMRDINAAAQHFMVNTSAYDNLGQFRLGLPDVNPMG